MQQQKQQFISLLSFSNPSLAAIVKGKLETEGIPCFLRDELMTQINPLYTQNEGGVKLQVLKRDVPNAILILEEMGYVIENQSVSLSFINKLDRFTAKIPFVKSLRFDIRLIVLVTVVTTSLVGIVYFVTAPTLTERLKNNSWCLEKLTYNQHVYTPETNGLGIHFNGHCAESINFSSGANARFPGFKSPEVNAKWCIEDEDLIVEKSDTFGHVYDGRYTIEFNQNRLTLNSKTTRLDCKAQSIKRLF